MKSLIERVWEYSKKNPHGFTINIETFTAVKFGIVVAFKETQNHFEKTGLEKAIYHALKTEKTIGGWLDYETGLYYFDSVKVFKNSELKDAIKFGIENEQIAIFDLTNLKEIRIK